MINRRYSARWTTADEKHRAAGANGIIEDVTFRPPKFICYISPLSMGERIAAALAPPTEERAALS